MPFSNFALDIVKRRKKGKYLHRAGYGNRQMMVENSNTFKHLPLNPADYHNKENFDRTSSSAELEGNGRIL
jgi:hypothetical protein